MTLRRLHGVFDIPRCSILRFSVFSTFLVHGGGRSNSVHIFVYNIRFCFAPSDVHPAPIVRFKQIVARVFS